ncbi:MAG TPA: ATP-binding cassette domain-containing protein [Fibrobacteraceae bacterium]|nr:ATP-binding cassette domain-containing protein [Fibrobacteraceae bacterium]
MQITSLTIQGGLDKSGNAELEAVTVQSGDICCLVGPTGSGKSRLLGDIEWLAQEDTPSRRTVLLNGEKPGRGAREGLQGKWVAQISQNMNFVLDMLALDFLEMHAESQGIVDAKEGAHKVIDCANELCGEPFDAQTPLTFLSGGQSRALMIADTAIFGKSPVVLIDEIENAGVDKLAALKLFSDAQKIVFLASHDPLLILLSTFRVVIRNGGMSQVIRTSEAEKQFLVELQAMDARQMELRRKLRAGIPIV